MMRPGSLVARSGNFLLVPPRGNLPGVNGGTSDFIGIYASIAEPNGCKDFDHNLIPGNVTRLYLLNYLDGALAIEVVDIKGADHLAEYSQLVQKLQFGS